jgi:hypothetical protein
MNPPCRGNVRRANWTRGHDGADGEYDGSRHILILNTFPPPLTVRGPTTRGSHPCRDVNPAPVSAPIATVVTSDGEPLGQIWNKFRWPGNHGAAPERRQ